ncbi:MAG: VacJ family lipoprotein [Sphingomonadaceae bacterium]|nr:VacJ family lipoprotein [Sphingomonadaceae bacterium]
MSFSILVGAMLLADAPMGAGALPPVSPVPSASDQQTPPSAAPPDAATPAQALAKPPAVPVPDAPQDNTVCDIVVSARRHVPGDPLQAANAKSFALTQDVDRAVVGPAALAYERTVPEPIRDGLRNFNLNLHEPVVFLNYLLQLKPGKAGETAGRFAVNSALGAAGLFDVARKRPFELPRRPNGFADTLGYYGVAPGPFFFLPLIGPTTLRDLLGGGVDRLVLPLSVGGPFRSLAYTVPMGADRLLDRRAEFDEQLNQVRETPDPYSARREMYLHKRQAEIEALHGTRRGAATPTFGLDSSEGPSAPADSDAVEQSLHL